MSDPMLLVRMRASELRTLRVALLELHREEVRKARRIARRTAEGKRTRTRPSEHAMYLADIVELYKRLTSDEVVLG